MRVAQALVEILVKEGIADAFGIPGAGINPVYQFLKDAPIDHYCMRHEEACTHAADGYYRASHRIALAICTSGPGATNFVTGLYTANIDSIPLLAITGQANTWQLEMDPFQCVDIATIAAPVAKKTYCLRNPEDLPKVMQEAFFLMRSGKPGPVLLDLPLDVQMAEIDFSIDSYEPLPVTPPAPASADIEKAAKLLDAAKAPIIIMGGGVTLSQSEADVIELAELLRIPVITTYMAKGGLPEAHPLNAGHVGIQVGQPIGNKYFLESDVVLGIGCRFTDRHTGDLKTYREGRKFIHVDIEPKQIGKVFEPDLGIVSDAKLATRALIDYAKANGMKPVNPARADALPGLREQLRRKTDYPETPIMPHRLFQEVNEGFDADTLFTSGCGITQIWSGQLQQIDRPMHYLPSGGAGTLGYEIPAAFGAKVAHPDRHSVTVLGDFGFTFMGEEIAVAAALGKPIIVIILNNAYLGLIRQNQKGAYGYEYAVDMPYNQDGRIDYVQVAQGYGCRAERVFTPEQLTEAIARAKASGRTYVIDAYCNNTQLCDMGGSIAAVKSFAPEE
ncbi:thiamine pyrophosphate-dependent enzyme [Eubacteriales bacterium OttesenSCG-928-A19]|nr:thiamine pyrophosphate-dependent enzyme [Eubacteriales bacterium OttesenSCG-928-A19]